MFMKHTMKGFCLLFLFISLMSGTIVAKEDTMTITFCDGSKQVIRLRQAKCNIKSLTFSCEDTGSTGFGGTTYSEGALKGNIYFLPTNTNRLPDFSRLTPVGTIYAKHLNIPSQAFNKGFPGVTNRFEWFAIRYTGTFTVSRSGNYSFRLYSDDGSRLYIDNQLVINNDGTHPPRNARGNVNLTPGTHNIRVEYFQGPRVMVALQLFITPPGEKERIL